jgi:hypothetical protein
LNAQLLGIILNTQLLGVASYLEYQQQKQLVAQFSPAQLPHSVFQRDMEDTGGTYSTSPP